MAQFKPQITQTDSISSTLLVDKFVWLLGQGSSKKVNPPQLKFFRPVQRVGRVPFWIKLAQGASALPGQHKEWAFNTLLLLYFSQVLGLSALLVGVVLAVATAIDAISDPLVGSLSDGLKSRLGRRHPLILFSIVPTTISTYALFAPPDGLTNLQLSIWLFSWTIVLRLSFSFHAVPWGAIGAELSDDYGERTEIIAFRMMMGVYIGSLMIFFVFIPLFPSSDDFSNGYLNENYYHTFALVLSSLIFFWMKWNLGPLKTEWFLRGFYWKKRAN